MTICELKTKTLDIKVRHSNIRNEDKNIDIGVIGKVHLRAHQKSK